MEEDDSPTEELSTASFAPDPSVRESCLTLKQATTGKTTSESDVEILTVERDNQLFASHFNSLKKCQILFQENAPLTVFNDQLSLLFPDGLLALRPRKQSHIEAIVRSCVRHGVKRKVMLCMVSLKNNEDTTNKSHLAHLEDDIKNGRRSVIPMNLLHFHFAVTEYDKRQTSKGIPTRSTILLQVFDADKLNLLDALYIAGRQNEAPIADFTPLEPTFMDHSFLLRKLLMILYKNATGGPDASLNKFFYGGMSPFDENMLLGPVRVHLEKNEDVGIMSAPQFKKVLYLNAQGAMALATKDNMDPEKKFTKLKNYLRPMLPLASLPHEDYQRARHVHAKLSEFFTGNQKGKHADPLFKRLFGKKSRPTEERMKFCIQQLKQWAENIATDDLVAKFPFELFRSAIDQFNEEHATRTAYGSKHKKKARKVNKASEKSNSNTTLSLKSYVNDDAESQMRTSTPEIPYQRPTRTTRSSARKVAKRPATARKPTSPSASEAVSSIEDIPQDLPSGHKEHAETTTSTLESFAFSAKIVANLRDFFSLHNTEADRNVLEQGLDTKEKEQLRKLTLFSPEIRPRRSARNHSTIPPKKKTK